MKQADVVIVGGSAAGLTAAITVRRHYPGKTILLIRKEERVLVPCGIPYIFGTLGTPDKNVVPDASLATNKVDLMTAQVTGIDREKKIVRTDEAEVSYDRLVLATGSLPAAPPIPGADTAGVFAILKDIDHLWRLQECLNDARDVVIVGGGFIGIEFADEINKAHDKNITIVEIASHCLSLAYDDEFCTEMEDVLRSRGMRIRTGTGVERIRGADRVESVLLGDGSEVKADVVILSMGAVADASLATDADLRIGSTGGVAVDRTMMTSDPSIFACGDCAEKISFFGGRPSPLKLASIATAEARIAGANLFGIKRENVGTVGAWSTAVDGVAIAATGLTEAMAKERGYQVVASSVEGPNRHPGGMPGAVKIKVKLAFEATSGVLLGGQVRGDATAGEIVNTISACVQKRMTAEEIAVFQMGTHPALTASPVAYPLVNAAEMAISKMRQS